MWQKNKISVYNHVYEMDMKRVRSDQKRWYNWNKWNNASSWYRPRCKWGGEKWRMEKRKYVQSEWKSEWIMKMLMNAMARLSVVSWNTFGRFMLAEEDHRFEVHCNVIHRHHLFALSLILIRSCTLVSQLHFRTMKIYFYAFKKFIVKLEAAMLLQFSAWLPGTA